MNGRLASFRISDSGISNTLDVCPSPLPPSEACVCIAFHFTSRGGMVGRSTTRVGMIAIGRKRKSINGHYYPPTSAFVSHSPMLGIAKAMGYHKDYLGPLTCTKN